jgi:glucan phosphoethanolaminetransferase (alkaline phosphatase superfamily)
MNSCLLLVGGAALLLSCVMLPLRFRARAALFAVVLACVSNVMDSTTVADNTVFVVADAG